MRPVLVKAMELMKTLFLILKKGTYFKVIVLHSILGVLFGFFYLQLVVPQYKAFNLTIRNVKDDIILELPAQETYLLKIWGDQMPERVYFNSSRLIHLIFRDRGKIKEFYYLLRKETIKKGKNVLKIQSDTNFSFRLKNDLAYSDFGGVLFKSNVAKEDINSIKSFFVYLLFILCFNSLGLNLVHFFKKFFALSFDFFLFKYTLSYLPCILFLYSIYKIAQLFTIKPVFFSYSFIGLSALLVFIFQFPMLTILLINEFKKWVLNATLSTKWVLNATPSTKGLVNRLLGYRAIRWWFSIEFSDKCVFIFICLVIFCALLLSFHLELVGEIVANAAYLILLLGVFIRLKKSIKKNA